MSKRSKAENAARQAMEGYQQLADIHQALFWTHQAIRETGSAVQCAGIVCGMIHTHITRPGDCQRDVYIRAQDVSCWQDCARLLLYTSTAGICEEDDDE